MKSYKYNLFMCLIEMRNCRKTVDTYGVLAKYVPPGSFEAMKTYLGLPGKKTPLFLGPTSSESQYVSVAQHLKMFGNLRTFGDPMEWPSSDMLTLEESIDLSQDMPQLVPFEGSDDDFYDGQGEEEHDEEEDFVLTAEDVGEEPHHCKDGSIGKNRKATAV